MQAVRCRWPTSTRGRVATGADAPGAEGVYLRERQNMNNVSARIVAESVYFVAALYFFLHGHPVAGTICALCFLVI